MTFFFFSVWEEADDGNFLQKDSGLLPDTFKFHSLVMTFSFFQFGQRPMMAISYRKIADFCLRLGHSSHCIK